MKTLFYFLAAFVSYTAIAQNKTYLSNRYSLERMSSVGVGSNAVLPGLTSAPPEVLGDPFSKKNFATTSAILYNDQTINGIQAKYDLLHDDIFVQTLQGIRVLEGKQVKSFSLTDSVTQKVSLYINAKEFKPKNGIPYTGFFEILYDGEMALFKKTEATIQKANYNATLNVGRRDHQITKKTEYYFIKDDLIEKLPTGKLFMEIFGEEKSNVQNYIKINKLDIKDERHLNLIFQRYNQIKK